MRDWSSDNPKAKLMAGKRAVILAAARAAFLRAGFGGASMEGIAAEAGVSIMTLYRHARTKQDLFQAVVTQACAPAEGDPEAEEHRAMLARPLGDFLFYIGCRFQRRLTEPEALALMRAVITESAASPDLAGLVYDELVQVRTNHLTDYLAGRPEASGLDVARCATLSTAFVDRLIGADLLRALLGLGEPRADAQERRASDARDRLLIELEAEAG